MSVMRCLAAAVVVSAVAAYAQAPVVGDINLYGLRKVAAEKILKTARLEPGSPIPPSRGEMEDNLGEIPGVVMARVEAVCCDGPSAIVFVGVEEKGGPHAAFRTPPAGDAALPGELIDSYHQFLLAVQRTFVSWDPLGSTLAVVRLLGSRIYRSESPNVREGNLLYAIESANAILKRGRTWFAAVQYRCKGSQAMPSRASSATKAKEIHKNYRSVIQP